MVLVHLAARLRDAKLRAEESLRRCRTHHDHHPRLHYFQLSFQPRHAGLDGGGRWSLVEAEFSARVEVEVLDRIGHVELATRQAGLDDGLVEQSPGGTYEGSADNVLAITGLLSYQHDA